MTDLQKTLLSLSDEKYAQFHSKLVPNLPRGSIIGVRVPALRKLARELAKTPECDSFLDQLPHEYYDENMLHGAILSNMKPFDKCLARLESFLPYVDNWACCDTIRPKVFEKNKELLLPYAKKWAMSGEEYTCRFGVGMLMSYFLGDAFTPDLPDIPAAITSEEYYVKMMVAWYFATALAYQWDAVIPYIEQRRLPRWTHNKAIQKSIESYRITDEQKVYLRTLKY